MGKKNGEQRLEKIGVQIDEKNKELEKVKKDLKLAQDEREKLLQQYKDEAMDEVLKECDEKVKRSQKLFDDASAEKEEADNIKNDAKSNLEEARNTIKEERAAFEKEKIDAKEEADQYSDEKHKEADAYYENKKNELSEREDNASFKEKELNNLEKNLREKENKQNELQNKLDKLQQDAKFGFQAELRKERVKFDEELNKIKLDIAEQEKVKISVQDNIYKELADYKKKEISKINDEIQKQRGDIDKEKNLINQDKVKLETRKAELEAEATGIQIKKDAYDKKYARLDDIAEEKLQELYREVINERDTFKNKCNELQNEITEKQKNIVSLTSKLKNNNGLEVSQLQDNIKTLKAEVEAFQNSENSIIGKLRKYNVDSATLGTQLFKIEEYDSLMEKVESLSQENHRLDLELRTARKNDDALELEAKRANQYQSNYEDAIAELDRLKKPSRKDRLSSFTSFDEFDAITKLEPFGSQLSELNWLRGIKEKMDASEIKISNKLLYAFHTSVKIHDWSPLVVLAGVSGTGKSELPRQYAHHGGMNFISVPVKPDWDSMQSLFGYYNSIENKFEPTELSRAIYYMQSAELKNTMLLVLLDEMNLAYVELYFSDLLSKFETNRGTDDTITYEISLGANEAPEKMEIGKNILWVGTMNEDETTKALSDKVVDRSTLLTFPRPRTLVSRRSDIKIPETEKRLTRGVWARWCSNTLSEEQLNSKGFDIEKYRRIIEEINDQMSKVNRNLGHRVWQSIERYVFSHPLTVSNINNGSEFKKQFDSAFAEAVAFKVMPKLRGIEVSGESKKVLESIGNIISQDIPSLTEDYKQAMSLSSRIFQWCSAKFMDIDEKAI